MPALIISVGIFAPLLGLLLDRVAAAAPGRRARVRAHRRHDRPARSRSPRSRSGWSRRSATRCSTSGSRAPTTPARPVIPRASVPTPRSRVPARSTSSSTATRSRCSSRPRCRPSSSGTSCAGRASDWRCAAVVDRRALAGLRGINEARTSAVAWVLSMVLAGLGGVLIAPLFQLGDITTRWSSSARWPRSRSAGCGRSRSRSSPGCCSASCRTCSRATPTTSSRSFLAGLSGLKTSIPFILTLVVLFFFARQAGEREAGSVADETPPRDHRAGLPAWRRRLPWAIFTLLLVAFSLQWFEADWLQADFYEAGLIAQGLALGIVFLSFVVVTGIGGMVSLAQATFVTAGGFSRLGWAARTATGGSTSRSSPHDGQLELLRRAAARRGVCRRGRCDGRDPGATTRRARARARARSRSRSSLSSSSSTTSPSARSRRGWSSARRRSTCPCSTTSPTWCSTGPRTVSTSRSSQQQVLLGCSRCSASITLIVHSCSDRRRDGRCSPCAARRSRRARPGSRR